MSNLKDFKSNDVTIDDVKLLLHSNNRKKPQIRFPFDGSLEGNPDEILTKIHAINSLESTRTPVNAMKNHIERVMSDKDFEIIRCGNLNEDYFNIVDKIAFGHGIRNTCKKTGEQSKEYNLTSFASKFCASHNQTAPFWDSLVSYLLKELGYKHSYRDYREYVASFRKLQEENNLTEYSLREIELAMWNVAKNLM